MTDPINAEKHPFTEELKQLMVKHDVIGITIFQLPNASDSPAGYHTFTRGHFYETAKLVSNHVHDIKEKMMHDLRGLM